MFVPVFAVILLCSSGINTHYVVSPDMRKELPNATYTLAYPTCEPGQTECGTGCCPFPDGVCCLGKECCPKGQVCIPYVGICMAIETETENGKPELVSTKATALIKVEECPSGTTECAKDRCCMYPDATCCSDGVHCCPNGYSCDLQQQKCLRRTKWYTVLNANDKLLATKSTSKSSMKSCPGGSQKCPAYTSCCLNDNGSWGCCPNPSIYSNKNVKDQNFCQSYFGYICCNFPTVCTYMGCM